MSAAPTTVRYVADPVTHLLASWRYSPVSRFVCGMFGYELHKDHASFRCVPIAPLNREPWSLARCDRLQNGIWMLHAENPTEGVGLFLNHDSAEYSESQMRIPKTVMRVGTADMDFLRFIDPLWPSIDQMEEAFWQKPVEGWESMFRDSIELMRRFKGARELFALPRLRADHPYANF